MKKIILMFVVGFMAIGASAQIERGLRHGIVFAGSMSKYSGIPDTKNIFGYGVGYSLEYNFNPNLYLGTGLEIGLRGTKLETYKVLGQNLKVDVSLKSFNLALPVNLGGRFNISDNFSIFGQVGPYVSFAAKKAEMQILGYGNIKGESFDWGFNAKAGLEIYQIKIFGGYELGMKEVWPDEAKNRSIVFGLGYMF